MPFDGLCVHAITAELRKKIIGTKLHKIYQPMKDEIVLSFSDKEKSTLLMSASASLPRVHLISERYDNPDHPPTFCMLLRKYLIGGIVKEVQQKDFDRIIILKIETLDEAGCLMHLSLISEIMGRHSNLILVNEETGKILDAIKHVTKLKTSVREVMPGKPYAFPLNDRINPMDFNSFDAAQRLLFFPEKSCNNAILSVFSGISPQLANSLVLDSNIDLTTPIADLNNDTLLKLCETIRTFFSDLDGNESYLYYDSNEIPKDFSYSYYSIYDQLDARPFLEMNDVCEQYYAKKHVSSHINEKYELTIKLLSSLIAKEEHKLQLRKQEMDSALDSDQLQQFGNLLLSNLGRIKKGMTTVTVENYFSSPPSEVNIMIRADYSPSQNAQLYFKKYTKAKSAVEHLTKLIRTSEDVIYYLSSQHYFLTNAQNAADAEEIIESLVKHGILKKKKIFQKQQPSVPHHYVTPDGFDIFVGKNDRQNDQLTLKSSIKDDIWLHTKDIPGSHVILKTSRGTFSEESLVHAAILAAFYSKASTSENVPVDYAYVKYVKKPSGSALGKVIYTNHKTLYVTPSNQAIQSLKKMK